jgi:hypothetical protein
MPFAYYHRLSSRQKSIYRLSDDFESIRLPNPEPLMRLTANLKNALETENQPRVKKLANELAQCICQALGVRPVKVKVLARRPANDAEELHGLYESEHGARSADITVWMRTAQRKQVVAFRTFLRTLLHELCHHLDYDHLKLQESFHTEGFYKRESSLFKQLVPDL